MYEGGVESKIIIAGVFGVVILFTIIVIFFAMKRKSSAVASNIIPPAIIIPPRPTTLTDCGYPGLPRGWYDIKGVGYKNDFCRNVGDAASPIWSCKIFNGDNETHTYDPNMPFDAYKGDLTGWHCP